MGKLMSSPFMKFIGKMETSDESLNGEETIDTSAKSNNSFESEESSTLKVHEDQAYMNSPSANRNGSKTLNKSHSFFKTGTKPKVAKQKGGKRILTREESNDSNESTRSSVSEQNANEVSTLYIYIYILICIYN